MSVRWFGPTWNAPVNEERLQIPAPVGEQCLRCQEEIGEDEQGISTSASLSIAPSGRVYYHLQCFLQEIGAA